MKGLIDKVRKVLKRMPNWKAPGPDLVQGFWLKNLSSLHGRLTEQLEGCLSSGYVPTWMTKGPTVLIIKDLKKGNNANNYQPNTCLPMIWKLLTGVIAEDLNGFLEHKGLLPEKQKGC